MPDPNQAETFITAKIPHAVQRYFNLWCAYFGLRKQDGVAAALRLWCLTNARKHPDGPKVKA